MQWDRYCIPQNVSLAVTNIIIDILHFCCKLDFWVYSFMCIIMKSASVEITTSETTSVNFVYVHLVSAMCRDNEVRQQFVWLLLTLVPGMLYHQIKQAALLFMVQY